MKTLLHYFRVLIAVTFLTAHNLLKRGGLAAVPLCFAIVGEDDTKKSFEDQMLEGVGAIRKKTETLVSDFARLDGETKKAFEELTKVKNNMTSITDFEQKLAKVNLLLAQERRMAFGNPMQRLLSNETGVAQLNYRLREIAVKAGDLNASNLDFWKGKTLDLVNTPGSTYFQAGFLKELYDTLAEYGAWSGLGVRRMPTKITKMPVKTARPIAYVKKPGSRTIADDANKAGTSQNLEVELIACLITVYLELLQDSEFDVSTDVLGDFIEAYNQRLDYLAFMGDGTDAPEAAGLGNSFTGVFNYWGAVNAAATHTTVETMVYTDVLGCLTSVAPIVLSRKPSWWIHPTMLARFLAIQDQRGRPIFLTALEAPSYGAIGSIFGFPVKPLFVGPNSDVAGAKVAAFGDPNSFVVGVRSDFQFDASDDFKFDQFERAFRCAGRAGAMGRRADGGAVLKTAAA